MLQGVNEPYLEQKIKIYSPENFKKLTPKSDEILKIPKSANFQENQNFQVGVMIFWKSLDTKQRYKKAFLETFYFSFLSLKIVFIWSRIIKIDESEMFRFFTILVKIHGSQWNFVENLEKPWFSHLSKNVFRIVSVCNIAPECYREWIKHI